MTLLDTTPDVMARAREQVALYRLREIVRQHGTAADVETLRQLEKSRQFAREDAQMWRDAYEKNFDAMTQLIEQRTAAP